MYISAGWRDKELSHSLSEEKPKLNRLYVEPALNHEMVRAVLSERQTSDCDVKCRITLQRGITVIGCGIKNIR